MRVLIDANVLYATLLRRIVLGVAGAADGQFTPLWSARILEEWARAAAREGPEAKTIARGEIALLGAAWPHALTEWDVEHVERLSLPDPDDRHVLAAAIEGAADVILTLNLKDFPNRTLARLGLRAAAPDPFILELWTEAEGAIAAAVEAVLDEIEAAGAPKGQRRKLLKRARLPRLGKVLYGGIG